MSNKETFKFEEPFKKEKEAFMEMMMEDHGCMDLPKDPNDWPCRPRLTIEEVQDLVRLLNFEIEMQYDIGMKAKDADELTTARRHADSAGRLLTKLVSALSTTTSQYMGDKERVMREGT